MKANKKGYSVLISLLLVGFIIILSTGIFNLILNEMRSNRAMGNYLKAYAGAESAQELALLKIKEKGYGYSNKMEKSINDLEDFNNAKEVKISYSIDGKVNSYSGSLEPLKYHIIPLFYIDDDSVLELEPEYNVSDIDLEIKDGILDGDLVWNIVGKVNGISGNGYNLENGVLKTFDKDEGFKYGVISVKKFLSNSSVNYLVLFNSGNDSSIEYSLSTIEEDEYFTKPSLDIISSGEISSYKQNLKTSVNNTELLNILKYSIYSK